MRRDALRRNDGDDDAGLRCLARVAAILAHDAEDPRADGRSGHDALSGILRKNVNDLAAANAAIEEVLTEVRRQIDLRPADRHRKHKH